MPQTGRNYISLRNRQHIIHNNTASKRTISEFRIAYRSTVQQVKCHPLYTWRSSNYWDSHLNELTKLSRRSFEIQRKRDEEKRDFVISKICCKLYCNASNRVECRCGINITRCPTWQTKKTIEIYIELLVQMWHQLREIFLQLFWRRYHAA